MKNVAFVFARGGSKGLPGKNIKPLAGKPLIQYSIDVALACDDIDAVYVSTDDAEIATVAKEAGAAVIHRPVELAGDASSEWDAWRHAVQWVEQHVGVFERFVSLPATSPLRSVDDVDAVIDKHVTSGADICITMTPASRSPFFNMVRYVDGDRVELVNKPDTAIVNRQAAPEVYDITTVAYVTSPQHILNTTGLFSGTVAATIVPKERAADIDDIYDFLFAEAVLSRNL